MANKKNKITEKQVSEVLKSVGFKEANGYLTMSRTAVKPMKKYFAKDIAKQVNGVEEVEVAE